MSENTEPITITAHTGRFEGEIVLQWSEACWGDAMFAASTPDNLLVPEGYVFVKLSLARPRKADGSSKGARTSVTAILAHADPHQPPADLEQLAKRWLDVLA